MIIFAHYTNLSKYSYIKTNIMKLKHLFLAAFAAVFSLTACEEEEDLGAAEVNLDVASIILGKEEASETVTFVATRDWKATCPDWIGLSATSGKASTEKQTLVISVEENTGNDRTGEVVISIGLAKGYITVTQKGAKGEYVVEEGDGTKEKPFSVAQACDAVKDLTWTDKDNYDKIGPYYVRGKVSSIAEAFGAQYGNGNFNISDDGSASGQQLICYRILYLENKKWVEGNVQIAVGDEVVIYGELMNYSNSKPETVQKGSYLYSLNGETTASGGQEVDHSKDPAKTVAEFIAAADASTYYKLTGKVSKFNATYCSFDLTDDSGTIYVYSVDNKDAWVSKIANGATVTLSGKYAYYEAKQQHEVINAYILSCDGGSQGGGAGEPAGTGTQSDPYNVAAAINAVKNLTWTDKDNYQKVGPYYVKGKVKDITEQYASLYGNATFTMVDDGADAVFTAYRILYFDNKKWTDGGDQLTPGDEVIIYAELMNYRGNTPETVQNSGYLYSLNGKTGSGGGGQGGDYQNAPAKTVAEFLAAADTENYYKLTGSVSKFNSQYCSFDLTDATGTIYVYSVDNKADWTSKISDGGTVTLAGKYAFYEQKQQHEVVNAYILSFEAGETPPGPGEEAKGDGTLENPYNPKAAYDTAAALGNGEKSGEVYVAGKISSIKYTFDANYGTATFNISEDGSTNGTQFQCYSVYYFGGKAWQNGDTQIAVGDEVIIYGKLTNYNGNTPETAAKEACIYSLNGNTGAAQDPFLKVTSLKQTSVRGFSASWTTNVEGVYYSWTLYRVSDETEDGVVYSAMGRITDTSVTTLNSQEGGTDGWYEDLKPGETYYFSLQLYGAGPNPLITNNPEKDFFVAKDMSQGGGDGTLTIDLTNATYTFNSVTGEGALKKGYIAEVEGFKVGTYQYKSTSTPVAPDQYSIRIYKSAIFYIEAPAGIKITEMVFKANDYSDGKYCLDLTEVETGSGAAVADKATLTIGPWTGESGLVYLQAAAGQVRLESVTVTYVAE